MSHISLCQFFNFSEQDNDLVPAGNKKLYAYINPFPHLLPEGSYALVHTPHSDWSVVKVIRTYPLEQLDNYPGLRKATKPLLSPLNLNLFFGADETKIVLKKIETIIEQDMIDEALGTPNPFRAE